jgi:Bacterial transcriptional activator domain
VATAVNLAQSYASRLRLDADQLDLLGFGQLVDRGRDCAQAGDAEVACQWYRQALGLWQGEPLAGGHGLAQLHEEPVARRWASAHQ